MPARPHPWEMTLREFSARGGPCPPTLATEIEAARVSVSQLRQETEALAKAMVETAGHWVKRRVGDLTTRRTILGALAEFRERDAASALRSPRVPAETKATYRQKSTALRRAAATFEDRYCHEALHRRIVAEAHAAGEAIPPDVLAEYPDLDRQTPRNPQA